MAELNWKHSGRFFAAAFLMDFSATMFIVALPWLAASHGAESIHQGLLGALRSGIYVLFCLLAGLLVDRWNRRVTATVAAVLTAAALVLSAFAGSLWQVGGTAMLWSGMLAFFWPSMMAWMGDSHPREQLGRATSLFNVGWSIGSMAGGVIAGWLLQVNARLPFFVAAIPPLLACALLRVRIPRERISPALRVAPAAKPGSKRALAAAWVGNGAACCLIGLMTTVFVEFGKAKLGVTPLLFGGVFVTAMNMGRALMFLSGLRGGAWLRDWRMSATIQLFAAAMVATVGFPGSHWWIGLAFGSVGIGAGAAYYLSLYRSLAGEGARGRNAGLHEATLLSGFLIGSLGGGVIAHVWGLRVPYAVIGGFVALLVVVQVALNLSAQRASSAPTPDP